MDAPDKPYIHVILQDHGENDGGWGLAAALIGLATMPMVYAGNDAGTIQKLEQIAKNIFRATGKPTMLVRYQEPTTLLAIS